MVFYSPGLIRFLVMGFLWLIGLGCAVTAAHMLWPLLLLAVPAAIWFGRRDQRRHEAHGPARDEDCLVCRRELKTAARSEERRLHKLRVQDRYERAAAARAAHDAYLADKYGPPAG